MDSLIELYKEYIIDMSILVHSGHSNGEFFHSQKLLFIKEYKSFGDNTLDSILEKICISLNVWGKDVDINVLSFDEFKSSLRNDRLNEIGLI